MNPMPVYVMTAVSSIAVVVLGVVAFAYMYRADILRKGASSASANGATAIESAVAYIRGRPAIDPRCPNTADEITHDVVARSSAMLISPFVKAVSKTYDD